jgi:SecD/SecF fusion protein
MKRDTWRSLITMASILLGLFYLYPTYQYYFSPPTNPDQLDAIKDKSINLGLDLQGGIHLVLEVDPSKLSEDERSDVVERAKEVITNRIDQFGVAEPIIHREGEWRIVVELPGVQDIQRAKDLIGERARLEFKILKPGIERTSLLDKIDRHLSNTRGDSASSAASDIFGSASDEAPSLRKYILQNQGGGDWMVAGDSQKTVQAILDQVDHLVPSDGQFLWSSKLDQMADGNDYRRLYYVRKKVEMTGEIVADAKVTRGQSFEYANQSIINFSTTEEGVKIFQRVTGSFVDERMAIILDERVYSAPTIQVKIRDGRSIITGSSSVEEAKDLAIVLRSGSLPVDVNIVEDRTVGPSLGRDSIDQGRKAALIGLVIVMIFMILYYGLSGIIADLALSLNLLFVMAILAGFGGTLTLPGIAGIILTIGMAVDANVLIFERIREELDSGKTVRASVETGYGRAFLTIVDANLTTIITAIVLYQFGTGPIKGFALTLMIGIICSMYTALFVTRTVFNLILSRPETSSISIGKLRIFRKPAFNILGLRKIAFGLSVVMILVGLGSTVVKGGYNLGIDFKGGTLLELHFQPAVPVADIRDALANVDVGSRTLDLRKSEIKEFGTPNDILIRVEEEAEGTAVADGIRNTLQARFGSSVPEESEWLRRQEAVGPKIGEELKSDAISAVLVSIVLIVIYIWFRFKRIHYGIAAVIALIHDVLITMGVFSLLDMEISLAIVAALLTIVGYSLNDTIVVFDRVREDLRLYRRETFGEILNRSINECLNRTVLTSGTTLFVVIGLLALGGEVIHDFAFALLVGVIAGTYSSSFVATPVVYQWLGGGDKGREKISNTKAATA